MALNHAASNPRAVQAPFPGENVLQLLTWFLQANVFSVVLAGFVAA